MRAWLVALLAALALATVLALVAYGHALGRQKRTLGYGQIRYQGAGPERWHNRYRRTLAELVELRDDVRALRARLRQERRLLLSQPNVVEAINLAAATYGYGATLWRKANCETGGTLSPRSLNSSSGAAGLFQFLPSTWASTPYARFSVWSPYANALAAGWMHRQGRGGEWACR